MKLRKNSNGSSKNASPPKQEENIKLGKWDRNRTPVRAQFPGPRMLDVPLRIAFSASAYADVVAHCKEKLDKEVCGVLAGEFCEDDEGNFVLVRACVRGLMADQGNTHVTYTQETWNEIHATMERDYPDLHILGWYHSHPGYGVQFSAMDVFIQKNFFSAAGQFGLVADPLSGETGLCLSTESGIQYVNRCWVENREVRCRVPETRTSSSNPATGGSDASRLESLENRLNQATRAVDELRRTVHRYVFTTALIISFSVIGTLGYTIYRDLWKSMTPPEIRSFVPIPVKIGDKTVLLGVGVVSWDVPPELIPQASPEKPKDKKE